ncbi:mis18-binding protein 1 isoform X2 [Acanthopagrus latus]|uniref:mis18-binding protein 1 isoform X2 n=1 Tax=Acanthopagrus latus TaxID=8177 RepID=UPI00187CD5AA|nr:mis18-binding protein 1 isoform X2 [Acanthopagrus latus]
MASYRHLSQHTKPRFESPAKVFAKLKSRVQREARCATEEGFTGKDLLCNARYKHGGEFKSPRKRAESTWIFDEHKESQRFGSYRNEVHAMTISPISSPQKTFSCSNISHKTADEISPMTERGHGYTPRQRAFLESTAVSQPHFLVRQQIHTEPPQIRDLGGFSVTSRTPVKMQPVDSSCLYEEGCAPLMSPVHRFPPMSLRKRKWEPLGYNNIGNSIREISSEVISQPKGQKPSRVLSEDDTHNNTCMEDLGHISRFSVDQPEMNQVTCEHVFKPPRSIAKKRCHDLSEKGPPMSPAKMFAYMKERERQKEQQEVFNVSSSTRDLFGGGFHQSRAPPPSSDDNVGQMGDITFRGSPESVATADPSRAESAGCQSDTDPSEDAQTPALPSQPCLFEDPLVLNTPRVSIPRNNEGVFKRNKWPQRTKFPSESVVYLSKWFLRRNHKGLFVDGIRREENIPWNSNIIVDRVSNYVLKTVTGRVYILVGKMNLDVDVGFPKWFLKKFVNGFPQNWKALYGKFLSESKQETSRDMAAKTKPDASSAGLSVKRQRRKPLKTPASSPPAPSSSTQVSRSGRVIKPPLEYWKGGRVILDAQMNVTIHECYDTSICIPEVTKKVARASKKPAHVFVPCNEGRKQCPTASINEAPVPLRKVKAPARKRDRATVKPTNSPESPVETISSPEEPGRRTSSRQRHQAATRMSHVDTVPQKQSKPEKTSTRRSKKQTPDKTSPVARALRRKPEVRSSSESPAAADETSPDQSSTDDSPTSRKKRGKAAHRKRGEKSQPSPSSESEGSRKELRKRTRVTKNRNVAQTQTKHEQSEHKKASQPERPLAKTTQSGKKQKADKGNSRISHEQDEEEWTEAELMRLTEAVTFYPKHMAGYWAKVARIVGTRSAEECHNQHTSQGTSQTPVKKPKKRKEEAPKHPDNPVISARVGTLKRKQQVRQFLETMPKEDVDDVFSTAYMQTKRFEMPSICPSEDNDFTLADLEPTTPISTGFPEVKTPQCLHITPGMMGSPNRSTDDKYVFQLQKRMKKRQFNVCKQALPAKNLTPTPSVKKAMRRCGTTENDTFVVWEMFPGNDGGLCESGEEEDFYFSDND